MAQVRRALTARLPCFPSLPPRRAGHHRAKENNGWLRHAEFAAANSVIHAVKADTNRARLEIAIAIH